MADTNSNGAAGPDPTKPEAIDNPATAPVAIEDSEAGVAPGDDEVDVNFTPDTSATATGSGGGQGSAAGSAQSTVQLLKSEAGKLGEEAGSKARAIVGDGKDRATAKLGEFSQLLNDAADTVDEKLGDQYGKYARDAATRVSSFADGLAEKDIDELLDDAREFVRASPAIAIGTAAALGFVLARVLRSGIDAASDRPAA